MTTPTTPLSYQMSKTGRIVVIDGDIETAARIVTALVNAGANVIYTNEQRDLFVASGIPWTGNLWNVTVSIEVETTKALAP